MSEIALPIVSRKRLYAFYGLVGSIFLFQVAISSFGVPYLPSVIIGWFKPEFSEYMIGGAANCALLAALAMQFHEPEGKVAGMQMMIIVLITSMITSIIDGTFGSFFLLFLVIYGGIALLHPGRQKIFRFGRPGNPELLALLGLAVVPWLMYIVNLMNQLFTTGDWNYSTHANIAIDMLLYGLLATFKTPGWRVPAWSAGFLAIVHGLTSILYPQLITSVIPIWGGLAVAWGLALISLTEWKRRQESEI